MIHQSEENEMCAAHFKRSLSLDDVVTATECFAISLKQMLVTHGEVRTRMLAECTEIGLRLREGVAVGVVSTIAVPASHLVTPSTALFSLFFSRLQDGLRKRLEALFAAGAVGSMTQGGQSERQMDELKPETRARATGGLLASREISINDFVDIFALELNTAGKTSHFMRQSKQELRLHSEASAHVVLPPKQARSTHIPMWCLFNL
eukprot:432121-Pleurochrysis_carterae.AAC.1